MAVHAHAFNLVDDPGVVLFLLCTRLGDLAAHILEEILRETLLFGHVVLSGTDCGDCGFVVES